MSQSSSQSSKAGTRLRVRSGPVLLLLAWAVVLRWTYGVASPPAVRGDAHTYVESAFDFLNNGLFTKNIPKPPLISWVLLVAHGFGMSLNAPETFIWINTIFDVTSIALLFSIATRLELPGAFAGIAFVALSPIWFGFVNLAATESLSVTLVLAFAEFWTRGKRTRKDERWAALFAGLLILDRDMFAFFPLMLVGYEWFLDRAGKLRLRGWPAALEFLGCSYALPVLYGLRNYIAAGKFTFTQGDGSLVHMLWFTVNRPTMDWHSQADIHFWNNNPYSDVINSQATPERIQQGYALMKAEVWDFVIHHPFAYCWNLIIKTARLWVTGWVTPFTFHDTPDFLNSFFVLVFIIPVLLLGTLGTVTAWNSHPSPSRLRAARLQGFLALYITAVTLPLGLDPRYSLTAYVMLALWLGLGLKTLLARYEA